MVVALPSAAIAHGGPDWTTLWTGLGHVVGVTIFLILLIILVRRVMPLNPGNVLGVLVITACMTAMIFIIDQLLYVTLLDPYNYKTRINMRTVSPAKVSCRAQSKWACAVDAAVFQKCDSITELISAGSMLRDGRTFLHV